MEVKTSKEFLEKELLERFKPDKAQGIDAVIQINVKTQEKEENWVVTVKDQKINSHQGIDESPTLTIYVAESDFVDIVNGKLSAEKAFFAGKVFFQGNLALALKMRDAGLL